MNMRVLIGALLSFWVTLAQANEVDCLFETRGTTYLNGVCNGEFRQGGSFTLGLGGQKNSSYFVSVERNPDGTSTAYWNERQAKTGPGYPLGTLTRSGACWIGEQVRVCAWKIGEDRWFADQVPPQRIPKTAQQVDEGLAKRPSSDEAAQQAVMNFFAKELKDPFSAMYRILPLKLGSGVFSDGFVTTTLKPGWYVCGVVNAKNAFGGYVGDKAFIAHFDVATGASVDEGYIDDIKYRTNVNDACSKFYELK